MTATQRGPRVPSCGGNKVTLWSQEGSCGPPLLRHYREEKLGLVTTYRGRTSVPREGVTSARSHTKEWHLQDFNQVRLPRADFPAGSCWARVSGLQWAWVTLICGLLIHSFTPRQGSGFRKERHSLFSTNMSLATWVLSLLATQGSLFGLGRFCSQAPRSPELPIMGAMAGGRASGCMVFGEVPGSLRPMVNTGVPGTAAFGKKAGL